MMIMKRTKLYMTMQNLSRVHSFSHSVALREYHNPLEDQQQIPVCGVMIIEQGLFLILFDTSVAK